jgi:hypothetical protein
MVMGRLNEGVSTEGGGRERDRYGETETIE